MVKIKCNRRSLTRKHNLRKRYGFTDKPEGNKTKVIQNNLIQDALCLTMNFARQSFPVPVLEQSNAVIEPMQGIVNNTQGNALNGKMPKDLVRSDIVQYLNCTCWKCSATFLTWKLRTPDWFSS